MAIVSASRGSADTTSYQNNIVGLGRIIPSVYAGEDQVSQTDTAGLCSVVCDLAAIGASAVLVTTAIGYVACKESDPKGIAEDACDHIAAGGLSTGGGVGTTAVGDLARKVGSGPGTSRPVYDNCPPECCG